MAVGQAIKLYSVTWSGSGTRTINSHYKLWIIAGDVETASRKAKKFLKKDGAVGVTLVSVEGRGTIDVF